MDTATSQLRSALVSHRQTCFKFNNQILAVDITVTEMSELLNSLENSMFNVSEKYHNLSTLSIEAYDEYTPRFDDCASLNQKTMMAISQAIRKAERKEARNTSSSHSHKSKSSKSSSGRSSKSSCSRSVRSHNSISSLKLAAAAKAVELKSQLKYLDQENQVQSHLQKINLMRKIETEEAKLKIAQEMELESVHSLDKTSEVAHQLVGMTQRVNNDNALGNVISEVPVVKNDVKSVSLKISHCEQTVRNPGKRLNCDAPEFVPKHPVESVRS
jgi:hypothetical protein